MKQTRAYSFSLDLLFFVFFDFVTFIFYFLFLPAPFVTGKKALDAQKRFSGDALSVREDELEMNKNKRKVTEAANRKYTDLVKASIKGTKRQEMQSQEMLRAEMQNAYKHGKEERGRFLFCFVCDGCLMIGWLLRL